MPRKPKTPAPVPPVPPTAPPTGDGKPPLPDPGAVSDEALHAAAKERLLREARRYMPPGLFIPHRYLFGCGGCCPSRPPPVIHARVKVTEMDFDVDRDTLTRAMGQLGSDVGGLVSALLPSLPTIISAIGKAAEEKEMANWSYRDVVPPRVRVDSYDGNDIRGHRIPTTDESPARTEWVDGRGMDNEYASLAAELSDLEEREARLKRRIGIHFVDPTGNDQGDTQSELQRARDWLAQITARDNTRVGQGATGQTVMTPPIAPPPPDPAKREVAYPAPPSEKAQKREHRLRTTPTKPPKAALPHRARPEARCPRPDIGLSFAPGQDIFCPHRG